MSENRNYIEVKISLFEDTANRLFERALENGRTFSAEAAEVIEEAMKIRMPVKGVPSAAEKRYERFRQSSHDIRHLEWEDLSETTRAMWEARSKYY